jgi:hypothetical protein
MKRMITTLTICALLVLGGTTFAAASHTWTGDSSTAWNNPDNWYGGDMGDYPGWDDSASQTTTDDTVTVDNSYTPEPDWPELDQDRTIESLTMRDGSASGTTVKIDTDDDVLTVTDTATFGDSSTDVESYVEKKGTGRIDVQGSIIIQGGSSTEQTVVEVTNGTIQTTEAP